ncbi:sulfite exporter TauE/SafE family protein [Myxococcota bacterium]|nr:sulfite exporter TauE/SafE family protein [Myxococcota bacterium]
MELSQAALLFVAGIAGGGLNSIVGGGTFVAFPAMLLAGIPAVSASATTTMALWPGGVGSTIAYRKDFDHPRRLLVTMLIASAIGGVLGGVLLLRTSDSTFVRAVPWLLLFATLLFTFGGKITARLRARRSGAEGVLAEGASLGPKALAIIALLQIAIAVYGGYFGGGMGIMMLATWTAAGMTNIHSMNGLRTLLGTVLNGVAVISFLVAGAISWAPGAVMLVGAIIGGYFGATLARRLDPGLVRKIVVGTAWCMTAYFFVRS